MSAASMDGCCWAMLAIVVKAAIKPSQITTRIRNRWIVDEPTTGSIYLPLNGRRGAERNGEEKRVGG